MLCDVNPIVKGSLIETAFSIQYLHVHIVISHFPPSFSYAFAKLSCVIAIVTHLCSYTKRYVLLNFETIPPSTMSESEHSRDIIFFSFWTCVGVGGPGALVTEIK